MRDRHVDPADVTRGRDLERRLQHGIFAPHELDVRGCHLRLAGVVLESAALGRSAATCQSNAHIPAALATFDDIKQDQINGRHPNCVHANIMQIFSKVNK